MKKTVLVVVATALLVSACTTTDPYTGDQKISNTAAGAGLGALAGASLGLLAGGNDRRNALIGAGSGHGRRRHRRGHDWTGAELRRQLEGTGVSVTRSGDQIILNMPSDITFNIDQDAVKPGFYPVLNSVALVLKKFKQTTVDVFGHTDSTGGEQHNFDLSQRRALAVANYLSGQGVDQRRFAVTGFGKTRPIASNATAAGREQNRRVEIQLSPLT